MENTGRKPFRRSSILRKQSVNRIVRHAKWSLSIIYIPTSAMDWNLFSSFFFLF